MFDSINLEQEADIATIQQDSTRHDQELPVTDEVLIILTISYLKNKVVVFYFYFY